MKDIDKEIIKGLADNNLNATETAKSIFIGHSTIYRHIKMIKEETGLNPLNFWDLVKLIKIF